MSTSPSTPFLVSVAVFTPPPALTVGKCCIYNEERDVLEDEMRKLDVCGMKEFSRLQSSEKTIAILGARWWPQTAKQDG